MAVERCGTVGFRMARRGGQSARGAAKRRRGLAKFRRNPEIPAHGTETASHNI